MAIIRLQRADAIIFQVVKKNLAGATAEDRQWQEHNVVPLAVKPAILNYSYIARAAITQTEPDSAFIDRFGLQLPTVRLSGTFGLQFRRVGLVLKDGYTRLLEFRDEVMKLSHQSTPAKEDGSARYVYAINYYDFINDENFCIDISSLSITTEARRNPFEPTYDMSLIGIGSVIAVQSLDPLLNVLLGIDQIFDMAEQGLNDLVTFLGEQPAIKDTFIVAGTLVDFIDVFPPILANVKNLISMYGNAVSVEAQKLSEAIVGQGLVVGVKG